MSDSPICCVDGCYGEGNITIKRGENDTVHVCNKHINDFLSKKKPKLKDGSEPSKGLPITRDGTSVTPGDTVFVLHSKSGEILTGIVWWSPPSRESLRGSYQVRFRSANQINTVSLSVGVCFSSRRTLREAYRKQRKVQRKQERRLRKTKQESQKP